MTALADQLAELNREATAGAKLTITMDAVTSDTLVTVPTYSVRLEAPSYSEELLTGQTDVQAAAALAEFTAWVSSLWS